MWTHISSEWTAAHGGDVRGWYLCLPGAVAPGSTPCSTGSQDPVSLTSQEPLLACGYATPWLSSAVPVQAESREALTELLEAPRWEKLPQVPVNEPRSSVLLTTSPSHVWLNKFPLSSLSGTSLQCFLAQDWPLCEWEAVRNWSLYIPGVGLRRRVKCSGQLSSLALEAVVLPLEAWAATRGRAKSAWIINL